MDMPSALEPLLNLFVALVSIGLPGLPPGERAPELWRMVPPDAVIALEWSARGATQPGAVGIEGILADPEIQQALQAFRRHADQKSFPLTLYEVSAIRVAEVLLSRPGLFYLALSPQAGNGPGLPGLRAVVAVHGGDNPDVLHQQMQELLPEWLVRDYRAKPSLTALVTGLVQFRREGPYLVWGFNLGAADKALRRLSQNAQPMDSPSFSEQLQAVHMERLSTVLWLNASASLTTLRELVPDEWKARFPQLSRPVGGVLLVSGLENGRVITRGSIPRSPRPVSTLTPDDLRDVPADAQFVLCGTFLLDQLEELLKSGVLGVTDEGRIAWRLLREALQAETQFDFGPEILAAFGNRWFLYSAPSTGGALGVGPVFGWQLAQPLMLEEYLPRVMERWRQHVAANNPEWALEQENFLGRTIYFLRLPLAAHLGILPCWCVTDRYLLMAPQPHLLRSHLRFTQGKQPRFTDRLSGELTFPQGCLMWGMVDSTALSRAFWSFLPYLLTHYDVARAQQVPSLGAVLPHLGPTTFSLQVREHAWEVECRNPLSLAAPLLAGLAFVDLAEVTPGTTSSEQPTPPAEGKSPEPSSQTGTASKEPPEKREDTTAGRIVRRLVPAVIRAVTPDDVQTLIPSQVFDWLEEGPTPAKRLRRLERRQERQNAKTNQP